MSQRVERIAEQEQNTHVVGPLRDEAAGCCTAVVLAWFQGNTLTVGLRHVCARKVGELETIDPTAYRRTGKRRAP